MRKTVTFRDKHYCIWRFLFFVTLPIAIIIALVVLIVIIVDLFLQVVVLVVPIIVIFMVDGLYFPSAIDNINSCSSFSCKRYIYIVFS